MMVKNLHFDNMVWNRQNQSMLMMEWHDEDVAFVKQECVSNSRVWRLFAANGTELAVADSRGLAFFMARQHNFIPQSVH